MAISMPKSEEITLQRKILGLKIRHVRTRAGVSLREIGQALGMAADEVAEIEVGQRDVSLPQLEIMAVLFSLPVTYFWTDAPLEEVEREVPTLKAMAIRQRIIGVLLRQARTESGHSLEEMGNFLGITANQISDYEFGNTAMPLIELEAVAKWFNIPITYFIEGTGTVEGSNGHVTTLEEMAQFAQLPKDAREFLANPANLLYVNIAMRLSDLSVETLRALAEGLLEVTY